MVCGAHILLESPKNRTNHLLALTTGGAVGQTTVHQELDV